MGEELKILAYGLSSTGKELNLDNMYVNGRYVNVGSDSKSVINKVSHADFQIYGVCDSELGVENDRELGTQSGNVVMQMMQRLQTTLNDVGKIEKERIWEAMVDANRVLKRQKNEAGRDAMGSCFASLFLHGNRGLAVHLGDSRIYVVRGGRMLQITDDHLESTDMYRLGVISQAQAEVHKISSNLTAYLGMDDIYDAKDEAFSKYFVFYPGDTFIICSDGVSDALPNEELERMVRLLKEEVSEVLDGMNGDDREVEISLATGRLAAVYLQELVEKIQEKFPKVTAHIYPIRNDFFGETITVAGLITGQDLMAQLKGQALGSRLLIPSVMLRSGEDVFLDDITVGQLEEALQVPIDVVESGGYDFVTSIIEAGNQASVRGQAENYQPYENKECK